MNKKELRAEMKRLNRALTGEERRVASERIFAGIAALPEFAAARCVGLFCALAAEPGPGASVCPPGDIDLIVVPGVAFTPSGVRLGRGKGFYDRYLTQPGVRALRFGVCYPHQLVGELPAEPHDVAMDRVFCGE